MECTKYDVYRNDTVIAEYMTLTTALLLIEAYQNHYYNDNNFTIHTKYKENHEQAFVDNFLTVVVNDMQHH